MSFNPREKVSVVIPCYNAERFLEATLNSLKAQTVSPWEILVIDDGSRDRSRRIARAYPSRILKVYPNMKNRGIGFTRGRGVLLSRGDYIAFLSADDIWDSRFIERSLEYLDPNHATYTDYYRCDQFLRPFRIFEAPEFRSPEVMEWALKKNMFVNFSSVIIPNHFFDRVFFEPRLRHGEDLIFLLDTVLRGLEWRHVPSPLLYYRIHPSQGTRIIRRDWEEWTELWNRMIPRLKEYGIESHRIREAYYQNYRVLFPSPASRVLRRIRRLFT